MIDRLDGLGGRASPKRTRELLELLEVHGAVEDELLYGHASPYERAYGAEEHALIAALSQRLVGSKDPAQFAARLSLLRLVFVHHCEREERVLIPRVERRVRGKRAVALAQRFLERDSELRISRPARTKRAGAK